MTEYQQEKYSTFWSNCKQNKTYYPHTHIFLFNGLRILDKTFHKVITTLIKFVCVNKQLKNKRHGAILFLYTVGPYLLFTPFHHCLNKFTHDFCSHLYLSAIYLSFLSPLRSSVVFVTTQSYQALPNSFISPSTYVEVVEAKFSFQNNKTHFTRNFLLVPIAVISLI